MNRTDIATLRLRNQQLSNPQFQTPEDVVSWLGAVQSQDYGAAKWALGMRVSGSNDATIDQAFNDGRILRTHVMRPTWHFVTPVDIRWMLELTAPRINKLAAYYYRQLELDDRIFQLVKKVIIKELQGGKQLTRDELATLLEQAGIDTGNNLRTAYMVGWAELEGLICSGARRGKQFTYALLDERAPQAKSLEREAAVTELARRYFTSHGPATIQDFVWWSGLLTTDAICGVENLKSELESVVVDDQTYWFAPVQATFNKASPRVYLLPNYDEYTVGYGDRSAIYEGEVPNHLDPRGAILLNYVIVLDSQVIGAWRRTFKKGKVIVELKPFAPLSDIHLEAVRDAAQRYADFLGLSLEIT